jgi:hypothetical protein
VRITVDIDSLGSFDWKPGESDPLAIGDLVLSLDVDQPAGRSLSVRLLDSFSNPLVGRPVRLQVVQDDAPVLDAGPADTGASSDSGSSDTGPGDAAAGDIAAADVPTTDARIADVSAGDSGASDGGVNKALSLLGEGAPVQVVAGDGLVRHQISHRFVLWVQPCAPMKRAWRAFVCSQAPWAAGSWCWIRPASLSAPTRPPP